LFPLLSTKHAHLSKSFNLKGLKACFFILYECPVFIFSALMPGSHALCLTWFRNSVVRSPFSVIRVPRYTVTYSPAPVVHFELECGPMPNPTRWPPSRIYIGGALCESSVILFLGPRRKVWLTPAAVIPCSNATNIGQHKTWTQSEFCTWQISIREQQHPKMSI